MFNITEKVFTMKINDKGDCITADLKDRTKYNDLMELWNKFCDIYQGEPDLDKVNEVCTLCEEKINKVFGSDSINKIFQVDHPDDVSICYFIIKLMKKLKDFRNNQVQALFNDVEKEFEQAKPKLNKIKK